MSLKFSATVVAFRKKPIRGPYRPTLRFPGAQFQNVDYGLTQMGDDELYIAEGETKVLEFTMYAHSIPEITTLIRDIHPSTTFEIFEGGNRVGAGVIKEVHERSLDE